MSELLGCRSQEEWGRLTVILTAMKVLTEADCIALANLCQSYSILINAQRQMNKTGILYKSNSGYIQQSPLLGIIRTQTTIVNNLLREFGLTLSSRTRVATVEPEKKPNRFALLDEIYPCSHEDSQLNRTAGVRIASIRVDRSRKEPANVAPTTHRMHTRT